MGPFWDYWYFHLPNYALAALMWTTLGRFVLGLFVPLDWDNYIWRMFRRLTDPILTATGWITPRFVPYTLLPPIAVFWIIVLRFAFFILMFKLGLNPPALPG